MNVEIFSTLVYVTNSRRQVRMAVPGHAQDLRTAQISHWLELVADTGKQI